MERYTLNFGRTNAGSAASFTTFIRLDTLAAVAPQPAITEIGDGWYYFQYDSSLAPDGVTQIAYTAICGTGEVSSTFTVASASGVGGVAGETGTGVAASAPVPYQVFFGTTNAGGSPVFVRFARADTHAALTQPTITEIGNGLYQFIVDWPSQTATSIEYVISLAGVELADVIEANPAAGVITIPAGGAYNFNGYSTANAIVNRAAVQCGLTSVADVYAAAASNPDFALLCDLLTSVGDDLLAVHGWTHLVRTGTFTTDGATTSYTLPYDYREMLADSLWDTTNQWPGCGPVSFQEAAALEATIASTAIRVVFQLLGGVLSLPIVPPTGSVCNFRYRSRYWVKSSGGTAPDKAAPNASDDLLLFDAELLVLALKLRFTEERGFDTGLAQRRYDLKLEAAIGANRGGRTLDLVHGEAIRGTWPIVPDGNWSV